MWVYGTEDAFTLIPNFLRRVYLNVTYWGKIANNLLERMGIRLPQYYNHDSWLELGKIKVSPFPWWRKFWPIKSYLPYFVGDRVKFRLQIENPSSFFWLFQRFGEDYYSFDFLIKDKVIEGDIVNREGDVEYMIGFTGDPQLAGPRGKGRLVGDSLMVGVLGIPRYTIPLFTAKVINKDRWSLGCVAILVTAFVTLCLGFIKIIPFWQIWIPEWITRLIK